MAMQLVKQQHMEENSRLRATLEEWSHRNAKVEHRLNQARQKNEELRQQLAAAGPQPANDPTRDAAKDVAKDAAKDPSQ